MGRLLTLMTLMILGTVAVRTQPPNPIMTDGKLNGVDWSESSNLEKLHYVKGVGDGIIRAIFGMVISTRCRSEAVASPWFTQKGNVGDFTKEIDSFYQDGGHISIPMIDAYIYAGMKLEGATKGQLDSFLKSVK